METKENSVRKDRSYNNLVGKIIMDTNKYRKKTEGYRQGYLRSALSNQEVLEFIDRYNVRKERRCYVCCVNFISPGAHIRRCPKCTAKQKINEDNWYILILKIVIRIKPVRSMAP